MSVDLTWHLAVALILLVGLGASVSTVSRLGVTGDIMVAAVRAVVQLAIVSLLLAAALTHLAGAIAFVALMFAVAVWTTTKRVDCRRRWAWSALAIALGVVPVLVIVFGSGTVPLNGAAIVPIAGIVIGNAMTAHTLLGQRAFGALRRDFGLFEAGLSLGFTRAESINEVIHQESATALTPGLDQTRTVGLVTLPGAFVGVLLGGGSALQAGAAQVLVSFGIVAAQACTVVAGIWLIRSGRLVPSDLMARLRE